MGLQVALPLPLSGPSAFFFPKNPYFCTSRPQVISPSSPFVLWSPDTPSYSSAQCARAPGSSVSAVSTHRGRDPASGLASPLPALLVAGGPPSSPSQPPVLGSSPDRGSPIISVSHCPPLSSELAVFGALTPRPPALLRLCSTTFIFSLVLRPVLMASLCSGRGIVSHRHPSLGFPAAPLPLRPARVARPQSWRIPLRRSGVCGLASGQAGEGDATCSPFRFLDFFFLFWLQCTVA